MVVLSVAVTGNPRTMPLVRGTVAIEGAASNVTVVHGSELFWRQLSFADFDVSEMSMASVLILLDKSRKEGFPFEWVALPVFTHREYFHTGILIRSDRGIEGPQDLVGKRVGVPEYQQTAAVWVRGVLSDEFGVQPEGVCWYIGRGQRSHAGQLGFRPPRNVEVRPVPQGTSLNTMLLEGAIDASMRNIRAHSVNNTDDGEPTASRLVRRLFEPAVEARRFRERTGLFPVNHCVIVRRAVADRHPWLILNIYKAFAEARDDVSRQFRIQVGQLVDAGLLAADDADELMRERYPYGVVQNRAEIETLCRYAAEQGLTTNRLNAHLIFDSRTIGL